MEYSLKKILLAVLLVLLALISIVFVSGKAADQSYHANTITSIDNKVDTVLKLTATSTLASAGVSAIPGDTATPIAEKLADFTEYFLLILCVLYAEKYLVTIIGAGVFKILIPLACLILIIGLFANPKKMKSLAVKLLIIGFAMYITIPLSVRVSDMIYDTYEDSINSTISATEQFNEETADLSGAKGDEGLIASIMSRISETASSLSDKASEILNNYVELLAVMIVTSCVIPLLVLLFFLWVIKILTGVEISIPAGRHRRPEPGRPEA